MKYTKLKDNEKIQIGDVIIHKTAFGKGVYVVHRLTKKYAWVKYNDVAEGKYPIIFNHFDFHSLPRDTWDTTVYTVYRPIKEKKANGVG